MSQFTKRMQTRVSLAHHLLGYLQDELTAPEYLEERLILRILDLLSRRYRYSRDLLFAPRESSNTPADSGRIPFDIHDPERYCRRTTARGNVAETRPSIQRICDGFEIVDPDESDYRNAHELTPASPTPIYRDTQRVTAQPPQRFQAVRRRNPLIPPSGTNDPDWEVQGSPQRGNVWVVNIGQRALEYLDLVLWRPVQLANTAKGALTSMHRLAEVLCRCGPTEHHWQQAAVGRIRGKEPAGKDTAYFAYTYTQLEKLVEDEQEALKNNQEDYEAHSRKARDDYGEIWLTLQGCVAEMPERLTFLHVLRFLPVPLEKPLADSVHPILTDVIDTLDERYGILCSCGLDPKDWLDRESPSTEQLRDIRQILAQARIQERQTPSSTCSAHDEQMRHAFSAVLSQRKQEKLADREARNQERLAEGQPPLREQKVIVKIAGFESYIEFLQSEVGNILCSEKHVMESLDQDNDEDERSRPKLSDEMDMALIERRTSYTLDAPPTAGRLLPKLLLVLEQEPEFQNDRVLKHCTLEWIGHNRSWFPPDPYSAEPGDPGILADPQLRNYLRQDEGLRNADDDEIVAEVLRRLGRLVKSKRYKRLSSDEQG